MKLSKNISSRRVVGLTLAIILLLAQITFLPDAFQQAASASEVLMTLIGASIWWLLIYLIFVHRWKRKAQTPIASKNLSAKPKSDVPKVSRLKIFRFFRNKWILLILSIVVFLSLLVLGVKLFTHQSPKTTSVPISVLRSQAEQGNAESQYNLAVRYQSLDSNRAFEWALKAAQQGYPLAFNMVGTLYLGGIGIPQNYQEAAAWLTKASEFGISEAQYNLSQMYRLGDGVDKNMEKAYIWLSLAKAGGLETDAYVLLVEQGQEERVQAQAAEIFEQIKLNKKTYCIEHSDYSFCNSYNNKAATQ